METKQVDVQGLTTQITPKAIEALSLIQRIKAPTPKFFAILRNIGIICGSVSAAVALIPVGLPAIVVTIAGYCAVASGVIAGVSQTTVDSGSHITPDGQIQPPPPPVKQ